MLQIGVIGYGYWGPNLVRNFSETSDCRVKAVCDIRPERLTLVKRRYPGVVTTGDYHEMLADEKIDAIAIASPISTHFQIAKDVLCADKHVLVEKPLAATCAQSVVLIKEAKKRRLVLMVDHTFVYTGAVRRIRKLVESGELGDIYYYDSVRVNLGLFQHDLNVLWDLAVHDVSVMDYILPIRPYAVSATGMSHIPKQPENIAYLTLFFKENVIGHIHVNWLAPVKVRRTLIGGSEKMVVFNDLDPSEKVKVYDKGITVKDDRNSIYKMLVSYRTGDMWAPALDITEALKTETKHFVNCIKGKEKPLTDGKSGLRVVRILEAATRSMANKGELVRLDTVKVPR